VIQCDAGKTGLSTTIAPGYCSSFERHIVCVGLSETRPVPKCSSIFVAAAKSASENYTPIPACRLPCAPFGVTQTTVPVMGIFSASSINASNTNTSSPNVYRLLVRINRPPFLRNGIYAAYKTVRSLIVRDRMPCFVCHSSK